jgi:N-acetyl sugar amidotransferase
MNYNTKYGLPKRVEHCSNCLMTNQEPYSINESKHKKKKIKKGHLIIDKNGMCQACNYNYQKINNIDWFKREKKLQKLLDKYRKDNGEYDCIVPGSGGKDSSYQAHVLKYKYGMNPLTITYSPILQTDIGKKNFDNWINVGGFDNLLYTPNGKVLSKLSRIAFINLLHPMQPFKFGIKSFAAKVACKFNINLIFYGEPYSEYGNSKDFEPFYSTEWFINDKEPFFGGLPLKKVLKISGLSKQDINPFLSLKSKETKNKNIKAFFLGWYLKWDPQEIYYYSTEKNGFNLDEYRTDSTYGRYSGIDDKFESLHFYCRYIKFGIGRSRLDASQEIRNNHITRENGINLVKKFDHEIPERYLNDCLKFMNISRKDAIKIIDKARPNHIWKKKKNIWKKIQDIL